MNNFDKLMITGLAGLVASLPIMLMLMAYVRVWQKDREHLDELIRRREQQRRDRKPSTNG